MITFDQTDKLDVLPDQLNNRSGATILENLTTAFDSNKYIGGAGVNSEALAAQEIWGPIIDELRTNGIDVEDPTMFIFTNFLTGDFANYGAYQQTATDIFDKIKQNKDTLPPELQDITLDTISDRVKAFSLGKQQELQDLADVSPGWDKSLARFVGGIGAGSFDPMTAVSAPFGGWSQTLWKNMLQNAAVNAGAGAISEIAVADWYKELGLDYTYEDFLANVAMQGAFGAAIPAAGAGVKITYGQMKKGWKVLSESGGNKPPAIEQALADALDAQEVLVLENPLGGKRKDKAELEHETRAATAQRAVDNGQLPIMPDMPDVPIKPSATAEAADNLNGVVFSFNPKDIAVDAKTFQFKAGGDEFGVTERLQGVSQWDPIKAGTVTVYEYADGRMAIADGHQRLGLAKRLQSQDPTQDIKVIGYKLRETDGITPEQARVIAAMKNIAEGTGTSIDAAKILRVEPGRIAELPPRSELVRQAQGMLDLTDNAFMAIVNEVIPANYGAVVGRLLADMPDLQEAAISILAKAAPSNIFQAEAVVRQVREAGGEQVTQIDLFGENAFVESFYNERARILDRTYSQLRKDKSAFENLTRNADRLEAEGNQLARDANERRATTDAQTISLLQAVANRKGALSDALTNAAKIARSTGSYADASSQFLADVRRSIESGDFDSVSTGDVGRSLDGASASRPAAPELEPNLEGFDEATGPAAEAQANQLIQDMYGAPAPERAPMAEVVDFKAAEQNLKTRQPVQTVDDIYAIAEESQTYIAGIGDELAQDLGVEFRNPGLKNIATSNEKMARKSYTSSNQMTDISRAGFVINKVEDADAIAARFAKDAEILDEGWSVTQEGYFDRKILVRTPNGLISEIQIWSPNLIEAKRAKGHDLYEKMRSSTDKAEIDQLVQDMRQLYAEALAKEDQSFLNLVGMEKAPKVLSNIDLKAASEAMTRPDVKTSAPSTAVQASPGTSKAIASLGENDTAGLPSQSQSVLESSMGITSKDNIDIALNAVKSEMTAIGEQLVIPGAERITPLEMAQRMMDKPMRGSEAPLPEGGLFDDVRTSDLFDDMDMEIPIGETIDPVTNERVASTVTMRDLKTQIDMEDSLIQRLGFCTT